MRTTALVLTALMVFGATAAKARPADAVLHELTVDEDADKQVLLVQAEEPGFVEAYFPFTLNVNNPSVDNNLVGLWIGVILPFGFLWSPYVFGDEKPGDDFIVDAIIIALLHFLPVFGLVFAWIPFIGWALAIAINIYIWVNWLYLTPVAIINAYDRSIGPGSGGGGKKGPAPKKRRRRRRREAGLEMPSMATLANPGTNGAVAF
jgi:hypothetical protein